MPQAAEQTPDGPDDQDAPLSSARINVAGHSIAVSMLYEAGQRLEVAEAEELNRARLVRLRAALRAYVQKHPDTARQELQRMADSFVLVASGDLGLGPDPTELQAIEIARGAAKAQIARQGLTQESFGREAFEELTRKLATSEAILSEARRRVLATQRIISEALGSDLGLEGL